MQDGIGAAAYAFDPDLSRCWMEQSQQFRGTVADVLMRLPGWLARWLPTAPGIRDGLIGSGFILIADCQPQAFS